MISEKLTALKLHLAPLCVHGEQRQIQGTREGDGQPGGGWRKFSFSLCIKLLFHSYIQLRSHGSFVCTTPAPPRDLFTLMLVCFFGERERERCFCTINKTGSAQNHRNVHEDYLWKPDTAECSCAPHKFTSSRSEDQMCFHQMICMSTVWRSPGDLGAAAHSLNNSWPRKRNIKEKLMESLQIRATNPPLADRDARSAGIINADLRGIQDTNDQLLHFHIRVSR